MFLVITFPVNKENTVMQPLNFSIIQEIKHQGICDASAATALGENKFVVGYIVIFALFIAFLYISLLIDS